MPFRCGNQRLAPEKLLATSIKLCERREASDCRRMPNRHNYQSATKQLKSTFEARYTSGFIRLALQS
jgi:hypothetical protein